jgi:hypothetical protein
LKIFNYHNSAPISWYVNFETKCKNITKNRERD